MIRSNLPFESGSEARPWGHHLFPRRVLQRLLVFVPLLRALPNQLLLRLPDQPRLSALVAVLLPSQNRHVLHLHELPDVLGQHPAHQVGVHFGELFRVLAQHHHGRVGFTPPDRNLGGEREAERVGEPSR